MECWRLRFCVWRGGGLGCAIDPRDAQAACSARGGANSGLKTRQSRPVIVPSAVPCVPTE